MKRSTKLALLLGMVIGMGLGTTYAHGIGHTRAGHGGCAGMMGVTGGGMQQRMRGHAGGAGMQGMMQQRMQFMRQHMASMRGNGTGPMGSMHGHGGITGHTHEHGTATDTTNG